MNFRYGKIALIVATVTAVTTMLSPVAALAEADAPYVSFGADLTAEQRKVVLDLLDLTEKDLTEDTTVTVTTEDEHRYLDGILDAEEIGAEALASCKVIRKDQGYGIKVETHNVTSVTAEQLQSALEIAGMENAYVVVAAPMQISGTAAFVGAMQAYAKSNGHALEAEQIMLAALELVTPGGISGLSGTGEEML